MIGLNDGTPAAIAAWVEREQLPYPVLSDADRAVALAYGIVEPGSERYVTNNADGRRPAVVIDEHGVVILTLPDLQDVAGQQAALAAL